MGIRFERVLANSKVLVINTHNRTSGTFVRFRTPIFILPLKKEVQKAWADVKADWVNFGDLEIEKKVSFRVVEVVLLMTEKTFRDKFPRASTQSDNHKLHEKFKNQQFRKPPLSNRLIIRDSNRAYSRSVYA